MKTVELEIGGMTCEHCARSVENAIRAVRGAEVAEIDYRSSRGVVSVPDEVPDGDLVAAIERVGYSASVVSSFAKERSPGVVRPEPTKEPDAVDLVVIGTGAAGMAAAIRAAEMGHRVAIVEAATIGGTCVNVGCIPSKNLIAAAERYRIAIAGFPGISGCNPKVLWRELQKQKRTLVDALRQAKYMNVLASYPEVTLLRGRAHFRPNGGVEVNGRELRAPKTLLAIGTEPWVPPIEGSESVEILSSTTVMELDELPESLIVLGGSTVGLELAQMFARLGARVTVLELMPRLLSGEDEDIAEELRDRLVEDGIDIRTGVEVVHVANGPNGVVLHARTAGREEVFRGQRLLGATGRRANLNNLGLEDVGVQLDHRGFVRVDPTLRTSNKDIFAAGDVIGGPGFVYVAAAAGRIAAENALTGSLRELDLTAVPRVTFTSPQVAGVGMSEREARDRGIEVEVSRLGMEYVPRALVEHQASGWIRMVAERETGRILGVSAIGPNAGELLGEATLAVRLGITYQQLADTLHPYLTWVEGLKLAAQAFRTDVSKLSCCA